MLLHEYMTKHEISDTELARAIGVTQPYVWRLRKRLRSPSVHLAAKIEAWSGGVVRAASFAQERAA